MKMCIRDSSIAGLGETFGVAPLEAMGLGLVPIVSNLDCFKAVSYTHLVS